MKKIFAIAAIIALALTSCVKNEAVDTNNSERVSFKSIVAPTTRATVAFTGDHFMCYAIYNPQAGEGTTRPFWTDALEIVEDTTDPAVHTNWSTKDGTYYWPTVGTLSFWAYYPKTATPSSFDAATTGITYANYVLTTATELMLAKPVVAQATNNVPIVFTHVGSQLTFNFAKPAATDFDLTITEIKVTEVYTEGDINSGIVNSATPAWSNLGTKADLTDDTDYTITEETMTNKSTFNVIPQAANATGTAKVITVKYSVKDNNNFTYTGTWTGAPADWEMNKRYNYNLTFNFKVDGSGDSLEIIFTPTEEEMTDVNNDITVEGN